MQNPRSATLVAALVVATLHWLSAADVGDVAAQQDDVQIETTDLGQGLAMLVGQGGNLGVCVGEDGVFLIDDQFAPLSEKILAAVGRLSDQPLRFVLNTHWHGDHTGGNSNMASAGAIIVAHDNVRERMSTEQVSELWGRTTPPSPDEALPVITFASELTFHLNGRTIEILHFPHAHTDGDAVVHFVDDDVFHTGDIFFNGWYPFIDGESGGSLKGVLDAVDHLLDHSTESTRFIPGHGPLATRDDLLTYRAMLTTVGDRLAAAREKGLDLEALQATEPTAEFDEKWGQAFLSGEQFVKILYTHAAVEDHHHGD